MPDPIRDTYYELCRTLDDKLEHLSPFNHIDNATNWHFLDRRIHLQLAPGNAGIMVTLTVDGTVVSETRLHPRATEMVALEVYQDPFVDLLHSIIEKLIERLS